MSKCQYCNTDILNHNIDKCKEIFISFQIKNCKTYKEEIENIDRQIDTLEIKKKILIFAQNNTERILQSVNEKIRSNFEILCINVLKESNIEYEEDFSFDDCRDKGLLTFDFYIVELNLLIELDGQHHFKEIVFDNKKSDLMRIKKHDEIKNNYCRNNNINLLRISHSEKYNIKEHLINFIERIKNEFTSLTLMVGKEYLE
jgi:very-short-patch-repair endonuclease